MESPLELPGPGVVGADVAGRAVVVQAVVEDLRADDHRVRDHDGRCAVGDVVDLVVAGAEVTGEIDDAVVAEVGIRLSGRNVDGDQLFAEGRDEDAFDLAVGPVLDAAGLQGLHVGLPPPRVALGVVEPQLPPGGGVEGRYLAVGRGGVDPSTDHERRGPVVTGVVATALAIGDDPGRRTSTARRLRASRNCQHRSGSTASISWTRDRCRGGAIRPLRHRRQRPTGAAPTSVAKADTSD